MFYVKASEPVDDGVIYLHGDNVYTRCLVCGKEFSVDLSELFEGFESGPDSPDMENFSLYCPECTKKGLKNIKK